MSNTIHAFDFLEQPTEFGGSSFYVLFGDDRFLQLLVKAQLLTSFCGEDSDFNSAILDGDSSDWASLNDELSTASLFDQGHGRMVVVEDADPFVKKFRPELENLIASYSGSGKLVLLVNSWPSNTKIYKAIGKTGCQIQCADPQTKRGKSKSTDTHRIAKWIVNRADSVHGVKLTQTVSRQLLELVEWNLGRADQELAKLALFKDSTQAVEAEDIQQIVGGWRAQSIWDAAAAAAAGDTDEALSHLANLLQAGEHPLALYGQLSWSLRRYGRVWEIISRQGRGGRKPDLSVALRDAGFRAWNDELSLADASLRQLGRARVKQLFRWLLETDMALKRSHSEDRRGRLALESLFFRMSKHLSPNTSN